MRPAVIFRKMAGSHRSELGAYTQDVLTSVLRTCRQRGADAIGLLRRMVCCPKAVPFEIVPSPKFARRPEHFGQRTKARESHVFDVISVRHVFSPDISLRSNDMCQCLFGKLSGNWIESRSLTNGNSSTN